MGRGSVVEMGWNKIGEKLEQRKIGREMGRWQGRERRIKRQCSVSQMQQTLKR